MSSTTERKLAAIMFTDIVGFTSIMRKDESTGISILENQESIVNPLLNKHKGNLVKRTGDGYLLEFSSSVEAVECAIAMQKEIKEYNTNQDNLEFHIRIGIHIGDIMMIGDDIIGDGVNIASRIEPMANPDGICMTEAVYQSVKSKLDISPQRISEVDLKYIDDKYTIYKIPDELGDKPSDDNLKEEYQVHIKEVIKYSIDKIELIKSSLFNIILVAAGYYFGFYIIIGSILDALNFAGYISLSGDGLLKSFTPFTDYKTGNIDWIGTSLIILAIFCTIMSSITRIKRKSKIVFDDIRNVQTIANILIIQMGYSLIGNKGDRIKFYDNSKSLQEYEYKIFRFKYYKKLIESANSLYLKFDGNTIEIEAKNENISKFIKQIKKYEIKTK